MIPEGYTLIQKGILRNISNNIFFLDEDNMDKSNIEINIEISKAFEISGIVFFDQYDTGIYRDSGARRSRGINNILIELFDENDNLVSSVLSKASILSNGYFNFTNIKNGKYKLVFTCPKDLYNSKQIKNNKFSSMVDSKTSSYELVINNCSVIDILAGFTKII